MACFTDLSAFLAAEALLSLDLTTTGAGGGVGHDFGSSFAGAGAGAGAGTGIGGAPYGPYGEGGAPPPIGIMIGTLAVALDAPPSLLEHDDPLSESAMALSTVLSLSSPPGH